MAGSAEEEEKEETEGETLVRVMAGRSRPKGPRGLAASSRPSTFLTLRFRKTWMRGSSPRMTDEGPPGITQCKI